MNEIWIYPKEYFCPIEFSTNKMNVTCNTRSIHHFAASWKSWDEKMKIIIARIIGTKLTHILGNADDVSLVKIESDEIFFDYSDLRKGRGG